MLDTIRPKGCHCLFRRHCHLRYRALLVTFFTLGLVPWIPYPSAQKHDASLVVCPWAAVQADLGLWMRGTGGHWEGEGGANTSTMVADTLRNVTATRPKAKVPVVPLGMAEELSCARRPGSPRL